MPLQDNVLHQRNLQATLDEVTAIIDKQEIVSDLLKRQVSRRQDLVKTLVQKQQLAELRRKLKQLHPADAAF